jgi:hypothetical protein
VKSGCYVKYHHEMTATREAMIERLVTSLHLNVPERQMLGSDSVAAEEVAGVVKRLLERNGVFPLNAKTWQPGETVFKGFFLVRGLDAGVQMIWQRSNPIRPTELADHGRSDYDNIDEAISAFITREWSSGIDGISLSHLPG